MSSDRLTVEQVAILKAADANGKLLHDTDMRRLFKHIEALEGEVARLNKAHNERLKQNTLERAATHKQFHRAEAAEKERDRLKAALVKARHELVTHNGLYATDIYPENREQLLQNGVNIEWQIDTSAVLETIDAALGDAS